MEQILVVDDRAILLGVQQLLTQAGYNVTVVESGNKALLSLSPIPQLMIMDLMLPDVGMASSFAAEIANCHVVIFQL